MAEGLWILFDLVLASLLLILGWMVVSSHDAKRGVILFIAFGLLLALIWARLRAPDLALAEAAIGAGLTGALLLAALRDEQRPAPDTAIVLGIVSGPVAWLINLLALILAGAFAWALLEALAVGDSTRLADQVTTHLVQSGVSNPVTSVLLNFRAYDTLLELAVLLAAVLGILALGPARPGFHMAGPVLTGLIRWLVPLLIVTAGYLLWVGGHAPGGAFQAGALLAVVAVLRRLGGDAGAGLPGEAFQRGLLAGGVGLFLVVGLAVMVADLAFLQYPKAWAGILILLIESAATLAISVTLALAYLGGSPPGWKWGAPANALADNKEIS